LREASEKCILNTMQVEHTDPDDDTVLVVAAQEASTSVPMAAETVRY
jgi:hypothetical protein